jgi:hypothetical protein
MTIERKLVKTFGATAGAVYVEDVFRTHLYTGTGSSQTINNGIDLATKGGMVWCKARGNFGFNVISDTARGSYKHIYTNNSSPEVYFTTGFQGVTTSGFLIGSDGYFNNLNSSYVSWTFRKQPKFFDVVTYTGDGANRTIAHSLGSTPGMIIVKRTDTTGNWQVYHRSLTSAANSIQLNLNAAQASAATVWNSTAPTSSVFSVGTDATVNASGGTYVAYIYAHDAGGFGPAGTDSVVASDFFTTNSSGDATVNLGWEPQFLLFKRTNTLAGDVLDNWWMIDTTRGWATSSSQRLFANSNTVEGTLTGNNAPTSTGFTVAGLGSSTDFLYLAIRKNMK